MSAGFGELLFDPYLGRHENVLVSLLLYNW